MLWTTAAQVLVESLGPQEAGCRTGGAGAGAGAAFGHPGCGGGVVAEREDGLLAHIVELALDVVLGCRHGWLKV